MSRKAEPDIHRCARDMTGSVSSAESTHNRARVPPESRIRRAHGRRRRARSRTLSMFRFRRAHLSSGEGDHAGDQCVLGGDGSAPGGGA